MFRCGDELEIFLIAGDGMINLLSLVGGYEGIIEAVAEKNWTANHAGRAQGLNGGGEKTCAQVDAKSTGSGGEWGKLANDGRQMLGRGSDWVFE